MNLFKKKDKENGHFRYSGLTASWENNGRWFLLPTIELHFWKDDDEKVFLRGSVSLCIVWLKLYLGVEHLVIRNK